MLEAKSGKASSQKDWLMSFLCLRDGTIDAAPYTVSLALFLCAMCIFIYINPNTTSALLFVHLPRQDSFIKEIKSLFNFIQTNVREA